MTLWDLLTALVLLWGVGVGALLVWLIVWAEQQKLHYSSDIVESEAYLKRLQALNEEARSQAEGDTK